MYCVLQVEQNVSDSIKKLECYCYVCAILYPKSCGSICISQPFV